MGQNKDPDQAQENGQHQKIVSVDRDVVEIIKSASNEKGHLSKPSQDINSMAVEDVSLKMGLFKQST